MTFHPVFIKNVDLILGDEATGQNFKCQLKSIQLTPDTNVVKEKTACPEGQFAEVEDPEWNLEMGYLYGVEDAGESLADYLLEHKGKKVPFTFRPKAGGPGYTGTVTLMAGGLGGDVGQFSSASVTLPLDGQPVKVAAITP